MVSKIDGNHVLYHYLEKDLKEADIWLFQMLAARLFTDLGIWLSPGVYSRCPILLPFAVRDPTCRPRKSGDIDQWGAPNASGYFRDDNSLIKSIPRSLTIRGSANSIYHGHRLGNGFVASHVWRVCATTTDRSELSSRDPDTYSFVPNLVWLPVQVAKLTDREGSFAQTYLQALSYKIYHSVTVAQGFRSAVKRAWEKLGAPSGIPESGLADPKDLAYFEESEEFVQRRIGTIKTVAAAIDDVAAGRKLRTKIISTRYTKGLLVLSLNEVLGLHKALQEFITA